MYNFNKTTSRLLSKRRCKRASSCKCPPCRPGWPEQYPPSACPSWTNPSSSCVLSSCRTPGFGSSSASSRPLPLPPQVARTPSLRTSDEHRKPQQRFQWPCLINYSAVVRGVKALKEKLLNAALRRLACIMARD